MSEEGYPASSAWDHTDSDTLASSSNRPGGHQQYPHHHHHLSHDSLELSSNAAGLAGVGSGNGPPPPLTPNKSVSPPLRTSMDSPTRSGQGHGLQHQHTPSAAQAQRWRDSNQQLQPPVIQEPATISGESMVDGGFDENVLRTLCDLDVMSLPSLTTLVSTCGVPLLLDRIKQCTAACKEVQTFLRKRALQEEEYGRKMLSLAKSTQESYAASDAKAGSFLQIFSQGLKIHETVAENRILFANRVSEMGEELTNLLKEVEKNRKQNRDLWSRLERGVLEAEERTEKCKSRFDTTAEELERLLLQKEGESVRDNGVQGRSPGGPGAGGKRALGKAVAKGGMLLKGKNPGNIQRQEDDIRARMSNASDAYRKAVQESQTARQEYFNFQLPRILRALKECADELDLGTKYHLARYAFLFESVVLSDGNVLVPMGSDDDPGLKPLYDSIDNRADFKVYMQNYAYAHGGQYPRLRRNGPSEEGFVPPILPLTAHHHPASAPHTPAVNVNNLAAPGNKGKPTFGVDLALQMARDDVDVPPIVVKCCEAIEKYGISNQGIYRIAGTSSKINRLKELLDRDLDSVDLDSEEWTLDINNVASVLKLWFRDLPDPLFTHSMQPQFLEATRNENERMRQIRLHERINDLPDANYATLKYFMGHLHKIQQNADVNSMTAHNLATVFGPTLFGQQMGANGHAMEDAAVQNMAIETILNHYRDIFVEDPEPEQ
ncbi:RhoGAP-domain-containing protein [Panus rudis PR-1116 ss-1]|nr:RhoGAP-domain-containing protein [Panus rudis PR-1116 ss-1]